MSLKQRKLFHHNVALCQPVAAAEFVAPGLPRQESDQTSILRRFASSTEIPPLTEEPITANLEESCHDFICKELNKDFPVPVPTSSTTHFRNSAVHRKAEVRLWIAVFQFRKL